VDQVFYFYFILYIYLFEIAQWSELAEPMPTLRLENYSGFILEKVVQYFYYRKEFENADHLAPVPEFPIEMEYVFPLMQAAHYLGV
jgi:hypothetical protein